MKKFIAILGLLAFASPAFAMTDLTVTPDCTNSPDTVLNWTVNNGNAFSVDFTWNRDSGLELGSGTVGTSTSVSFSTGSQGSGTTTSLSLSYFDVDAATSATTTALANYSACPAPVVSGPSSPSTPGGRTRPVALINATGVELGAYFARVDVIYAQIRILTQLIELQKELDALVASN